MNRKDQQIIDAIVRDVVNYSRIYNCSLDDAFKDIINEEPTESHHAKGAKSVLGVTVSEQWIAERTASKHEVDSYCFEQYRDGYE